MYYGTGTTTYTLNAKGQLTLWSQEAVLTRPSFDVIVYLCYLCTFLPSLPFHMILYVLVTLCVNQDVGGPLGLTDREKMRLRYVHP